MWQKLRQHIAEFGILDAGLYLLGRLLRKSPLPVVISKFYIVAQPVSAEPLVPERRGRNISVRQVMPDERHGSAHPCPRPAQVIARRYAQSAICYGAFKGEAFAGCIWLVADRYREDVVRCVFEIPDGNCIWDFDAFVDPQYRLSPVFLKLWDCAYEWMRQHGRGWSLSRISAFNRDSLNVHGRMGAITVGSATFLAVGRAQIAFSTLAPHLHLSLNDDQVPVYAVHAPNRT